MRILFSFFLAFMAVFSPALASDGADAPEWKIIAEDSTLEFEGTQMGAPFKGVFKSFDGIIHFDAGNLKGSNAQITIEMDSVDANSPDRNGSIRMPDWLDTVQFPQARFITMGFEKGLAPDQYVASGQLTIRNVTLPVTLPFTLVIDKEGDGNEAARMTGETMLNRLDFGVGQGEWKDTKSVGNEVRVRISLKAVRK